MKKIIAVGFCLLLIIACFSGCKDTEEGCTKYALKSMGMGTMLMSAKEIRQEIGVSDLYLKLYDDGTAKMRISESVIEMEYADGQVWRTDTPDEKATYVIEGDTVTITDGAYTYIFSK